MRLWFALLLTLSFALQGWAGVRASDVPCPMGLEMAADMELAGAVDAFANVGDCCNDLAGYLATGQLCKSGQDCQVPSTALPPVQRSITKAARSQSVPPVSCLAAPPPLVNAVWRPPTPL